MAHLISLLEYLQGAPAALNILYEGTPTQNTTSDRYTYQDIANVGRWATFNLQTILQRYNSLLTVPGLIDRELMPTSPTGGITSEDVLRSRIVQYLESRVRRSLRTGFLHLQAMNTLGQLTPLTYDHGNMARIIDYFKPDTSYFDPPS
jgi:hypothetical protein